ncbi:hypothetical protein HD601_004950 [Jiangella mangrovi]|uniref:Uncharacterized protein n=1 Tax=Jiangella mangrovi TaxID=1524084 RepID=A0A7W9LNJ4_9ACTN|nr:hypothetical protein [Jiangella mangrovi]
MYERHVLSPLRRWLIDTATPQRIAVALLVAVLLIAVSLVMLENERDRGGVSDMVEIENPG